MGGYKIIPDQSESQFLILAQRRHLSYQILTAPLPSPHTPSLINLICPGIRGQLCVTSVLKEAILKFLPFGPRKTNSGN